ncbi:dienelactone hydrolase family protein [Flavobacterium sp. MFBS3-15]|uniref:dienelactone hydrolase family protein n=1 Tax=Flavobacterium sp. MFBS3-15 TaxID=2989816 RepID=UPI0022363997|nr:dienelactone hydrolase family protein [Flavobacterium sp. MFBS3-15]MCW4470167.1 dienelactone hydrolase family protein [Flavobacterium sp. MFBS3-15]
MKIKLLIITLMMALQVNAQLKPIAYKEGSQKLNGFSGVPKKPLKQNPGILILPAWMGINNHTKEVATKLNELGYYAFVADIYGEGNTPTTPQQAGEKSGYYKNNPELYQKRIKAALDALIASGADKDNIVVIGYCFGGTGALEAARGGLNVKGVVSLHGGLGKDASRPNGTIKPKVLILHGADDPYVPQKDIEAFQKEMKDGKADWQMVYYSGAVHAFTEKEAGNDNSKGAAYNATADKRSWEHFLLFLEEVFKQ